MKNKFLSIILTIVMLLIFTITPVYAANTLTISTLAELEAFRDSVNSGNHYEGVTVVLANDIDLNGSESNIWVGIGQAPEDSNRPGDYYFAGTFDGGNHTVSGLYAKSEELYQGFFSKVKNGTVKNLKVKGSVIGNMAMGGVVADISHGSISNSHFKGIVDILNWEYASAAYIGGIAGSSSEGTISDCSVEGRISGKERMGGIVGDIFGDVIERCYNTASVYATGDEVGGIVGHGAGAGYEQKGKISECYNIGSVTCNITSSTRPRIGGIAGYSTTPIMNCYNTGDISASALSLDGGFIGGIVGFDSISGVFRNTTWGEVIIDSIDSYGDIINCYNTGSIKINGRISGETPYIGSITGNKPYFADLPEYPATIKSCYYLPDSDEPPGGINSADSAGEAEKRTYSEFANQNTFAGWDFETIWIMDETLQRPILKSIPEMVKTTASLPKPEYTVTNDSTTLSIQLMEMSNCSMDVTVTIYSADGTVKASGQTTEKLMVGKEKTANVVVNTAVETGDIIKIVKKKS